MTKQTKRNNMRQCMLRLVRATLDIKSCIERFTSANGRRSVVRQDMAQSTSDLHIEIQSSSDVCSNDSGLATLSPQTIRNLKFSQNAWVLQKHKRDNAQTHEVNRSRIETHRICSKTINLRKSTMARTRMISSKRNLLKFRRSTHKVMKFRESTTKVLKFSKINHATP